LVTVVAETKNMEHVHCWLAAFEYCLDSQDGGWSLNIWCGDRARSSEGNKAYDMRTCILSKG
jgi:hypothetical protein